LRGSATGGVSSAPAPRLRGRQRGKEDDVNLFRFIPGYEAQVYESHKEPLLLLFLAFLVTFVLVRLYTRLARTHGWGSANVGGVHLHHMVIGVVLMVGAGILSFRLDDPDGILYGIAATLFGVGTALTLDEFAMIFHLKDVYWAKEGRASVDALIMGLAAAGLLLLTSNPFAFGADKAGVSALNITLAVVTFLKRKPFLGIVALLVPLVGFVPAIRLAKPDSPWARWFYDPDRGRTVRRAKRARKRARSAARYEQGRSGRFERWFSDLVGGAPTPAPPAPERLERGPGLPDLPFAWGHPDA
jgi:hypothetical protein